MTIRIISLLGLFSVLSFSLASSGGEFNYIPGHEHSPPYWGQITDEFKTCGAGTAQSPINVPVAMKMDSKYNGPKPNLHFSKWRVEHESVNFALQCENTSGECGRTTFNGKTYKLINIHFHSPSEHTVHGKQYPLEAHHVHRADDGSLAVISVLFDYGHHNHFFHKILKHASPDHNPNFRYNPSRMVEGAKYCTYSGSLTTPPCSETVTWMLQKKVQTVGKTQVRHYVETIGEAGQGKGYGNNRPIQSLHGREVTCFV